MKSPIRSCFCSSKYWTFCSFLFLLFPCTVHAGKVAPGLILQSICVVNADHSVALRTSIIGEENIAPGIFQGFAQEYINLNQTISGVKFTGRANPATSSSITVRVFIYASNIGLPGIILGQTSVLLNAQNSLYEVVAMFSNPVIISAPCIISIEPLFTSSDNFFLGRNEPPDGQNLNLIKIKQSNQWFNNLAMSDPVFDFDFQIFPLITDTVDADFTYQAGSNLNVDFSSAAGSGSIFHWDFGDGFAGQSGSTSHTYQDTGIYTVKLVACNIDSTCCDSITKSVEVLLFSTSDLPFNHGHFRITGSNVVSKGAATLYSSEGGEISITEISGKLIKEFTFMKNETREVNLSDLSNGLYYFRDELGKTLKIIVMNK